MRMENLTYYLLYELYVSSLSLSHTHYSHYSHCDPYPSLSEESRKKYHASPASSHLFFFFSLGFDQLLSQADELIIASKYDKEYLPITGFPEFTKQAAILAYGTDSAPLKEGRVSFALTEKYLLCPRLGISLTPSLSSLSSLV